MLLNYDLPWNPQRVEQRIGRCHRYGQRFDVVVINFLNTRNQADQRVLELLTDKFHLFSGVFGASDEVLGQVAESGLDFEKRILQIYESCRRPEDIQAAFDALQAELEAVISQRIHDTQRQLLAASLSCTSAISSAVYGTCVSTADTTSSISDFSLKPPITEWTNGDDST